ncbi:MAG: glycosyltransferase family 39 protein [Alphaproteobacteria bacterium]|nr:glycosyltransferase family 39 protein [Alphaproteobacteria bacterium]
MTVSHSTKTPLMRSLAEALGRIDPALERRALLAILIAAAAVRLAMAPVVASKLGYLPDVLSYRTIAEELLASGRITNHAAMPGYPIVVLLSGGGGLGQLLADVALSVLSVWCVARMARDLTGDALSGLVAAAIWAVYPMSIFYAVVGLTETLFVTLVLLGFYGYQRAHYSWGSVAMVAAILTRPAVELLAPILVLCFALLVHRQSVGRALRHLGLLAAIYVALMSPWWWHNYQLYGQFVRLNLGGGLVLYSGNHPGNRDGGGVDVSIDVPGYYEAKGPMERDRLLRDAAWRFIAESPRRFAELAGLKFVRLWKPWPHAADYSGSAMATVAAASYLPVLALAVAGAIGGARRHWRQLVPIALFIGFLTAVHMVTIGSLRYRFPMEPFLVIVAAAPAAWLLRRMARLVGGRRP